MKQKDRQVLDSWLRNTHTNDVRDILEWLGYKGMDQVLKNIIKFSPREQEKPCKECGVKRPYHNSECSEACNY